MKRFSPKIESKLLVALSRIFNQEEANPISEDEAVSLDYFSVIDDDNMCMVIPLTEEATRTLARFGSKERIPKEPQIKYDHKDEELKDKTIKSSYSIDYVKKIIDTLTITDDIIKIYVDTNKPARFENNHFRFYLAPRILED